VGICGDQLQAKRVLSGGNHGQRDRPAIENGEQVFGFQPGAQAGIVNISVAVPEIGRKRALDLQVIEVQFDLRNVLWKMALDVARADMKTGHAPGLPLCFHYHNHPFEQVGMR